MQNDSECQTNRHPAVPGGCLTGKETIDDGEAGKGVAENGGLGFGAGLGVGVHLWRFAGLAMATSVGVALLW